MRVLLVEPDYYTQYPPLGLLKLSTLLKQEGHEVRFVRGLVLVTGFKPDQIYVTSLFTWAWRPVWKTIEFYRALFPKAKILLGGIYASLTPEHAEKAGADEITAGLVRAAEDLLPDYSLVPEWNAIRAASILFSHRGCVRACSFCAVPALEGKPFQIRLNTSIRHLIYPGHKSVVLWDNNILGEAHWRDVIEELKEFKLAVDFNQGLDARFITEEVAHALVGVNIPTIRLAYDHPKIGRFIKRGLDHLKNAGITRNRKRHMVCYVLYNYKDTPEDLFERVRDLLEWGIAAYPMRYQPLSGEHAFEKDSYIASGWTWQELEMVSKARRVIGFGGAFPPYEGLRKKFAGARNFVDAFSLYEYRDTPKDRLLAEFITENLREMGEDHQFPIIVARSS